jgi:ABC-type multidrug transport system permease subunit
MSVSQLIIGVGLALVILGVLFAYRALWTDGLYKGLGDQFAFVLRYFQGGLSKRESFNFSMSLVLLVMGWLLILSVFAVHWIA